MRLRDIPWLAFLLAALCGWLGHRIGFDVGRRTERARQLVESHHRFAASTRAEMAARNVVWRTLNGDETPDRPERRIAFALMRILDPRATPEVRWHGLHAFRTKANAYLDDTERARQQAAFEADPSFLIDMTFARLAAYDARAGNLIASVMADTERITLYMRGESIPLELDDDGNAP